MRVLITGAKGFIGKNLIVTLDVIGGVEILQYDIDTDLSILNEYTKICDFVFHLAGVNRPDNPEEFMKGNFGFTATLLKDLKSHGNNCPVLITSSVQAVLNNPYSQSKKAVEELAFSYGRETCAKMLVYRLPNVFGKWCRPNYNSAVATFCNNIARDLPITVNDPDAVITLAYIDDVVEELLKAMNGKETRDGDFCIVPLVYPVKISNIVDLIYSFRASRQELTVPDMSNAFVGKLYSAYLSYLPEGRFSYPLKMSTDSRGSFTEFIRTPDRGQVSVNILKPGITKGNHWHHTKNEKFLVVSGKGIIRFRKVGSDKVIEYHVSGDRLEVVDIPAGYIHNIENLCDTDMVTMIWANECFCPERLDTYYLEVSHDR